MVAMCANPHAPTDAEMMKRLLVEMRQYRGKHGIYAAEMLETARLLLDQPEQHPRQAEAVAYCTRQAVGEIFGDTRDYTEPLSDMVWRVAKAKDRVQAADMADKGTLRCLDRVVEELKDRVCSPKPESRLKEIFREDSWIEPEDGPHPLIRDYRRIKKKSNELAHHVSEVRTDADEVRDHYEEVVDTLALIFLPTERLARIERLAELPAPQKSDLDELRRIMKHAYGFDHFARKMNSPDWFDLMDPDMLKFPSGKPPWLLRSLARHLKDEHVDAFVGMLDKHFDRWVSDEASLEELGFVGYMLGDNGLPWLVKTLQASKEVRIKLDEKIKVRRNADRKLIEEIERMNGLIWNLDNYLLRAFLKIKQPNSGFIELAEHLLSSTPAVDTDYKTTTILVKLVEVMDSSFSIQTIKILAKVLGTQQNLKGWATYKRTSVVHMNPDSPYKIDSKVGILHRALEKAGDLGILTPKLVGVLDTLPDAIRSRFVAWLYSRADDIDRSELMDFIVGSCSSRSPTDDDDLLLGRLGRDGGIGNDLAVRIRSIIGKAPEPAKMVGRPNQWDLGPEKLRCIMWARTIRPWIDLPDEWKPCLDIMDSIYEAEYDSGSWQALGAPETQDDATLSDRYSIADPLEAAVEIAAKEPTIGGFPEPLGGYSPILDLENMVMGNASKWAENPVEIVRRLHRPEYVAGYFRGLTGSKEALAPNADQIVSAIKFVRMHQWDGAISGPSAFYNTDELMKVDVAGMGLIEEMVKNDVSLGKDALVEAWSFVIDAVVLPETEEPPDYSVEYLYTIHDLPHVQAVYTLLEVILYAKRNNMEVSKAALARIAQAIRLTGKYGVDYHACIGSGAPFLHWVDPDWFEQNEQYLFGSSVSAELGRVALDMCMIMNQPNAFILEKYRDGVLDAVKRDTPRALQHLRCGLLWGIPDYDPKHVAKELLNIGPEYVSKTGGWDMFDMLREGAGAEHVRRAVDFWESILNQSPKPEALVGFGWYANVPGIDQERWEKLMMRTCKMAKKLDCSWGAAERISTSQTITDTGLGILARLLKIDIGSHMDEVAKYAMDTLRKTVDATDALELRSHLREVLVDHGFRNANKIK